MRFESNVPKDNMTVSHWSGEPYASPGCRALIVEDDPAIRLLAARILRREGFSVHEATNGSDALATMAAANPFDVIVLDLAMPGMSGAELIEHLRDHEPEMLDRIVVVTADVQAVRRDQPAGICHVLMKPFDVNAFIAAVRACTAVAKR